MKLPAPHIPDWILNQLPDDIERYCLPVGKHTIHVMEYGEGYPVLMLHGNPTWGFLYRRLLPLLKDKKIRLIMPDLVGLGFSSKPKKISDHTLLNHKNWILDLIHMLKLEHLIFVGQDWGGPIGIRALSEIPNLMQGCVILNTMLGPPKPGFRPTWFHRFANKPIISDFVFRCLSFPQKKIAQVQGDPNSIQGDIAKAYIYPLRKFHDRVAPLALARMVPDSLTHASVPELQKNADYLKEFKGPCEIIWGQKDPVLGKALKRVQEILPNAKVTLTDGGHFLQEEVPADIAKAIMTVLNRVNT